ncbi:hypothetical protein RB620_25590 [Paenibacillus sp. LHD-117]|uniref:hypothetical protein n=1 Tax=Paenibacillus sp. LHD-117 TaxID=3071412 RepID=UPI0027E041CA|nr:hypothetical protein [Paenibacillus sp. LHD-117]MDQ6422805.1 hypothetical protein [Paenibacillus sp. LHD-117]
MKRLAILFIITAAFLTGCSTGENRPGNDPVGSATAKPSASGAESTPGPSAEPSPSAEGGGQDKKFGTPQDAAAAIMLALKDSDPETLKSYVHPEKGVLFSPYVHVDAAQAKRFSPEELPGLADDVLHVWGSYDGSGEPIELTFGDYFKKFIYDKDFLYAEKVGWDEILGKGNTEPNLKDVFPGCYVVDYHFSGFDEQYEGMDWESLILVLESHEGGWYLSALVHNGWTI